MGIPAEQSSTEFAASQKITTPLTLAILSGINNYSYEIYCDQISARSEVRSTKREVYRQRASDLNKTLPGHLQRAMELAQEKGSSIWLTTIPIEEHGFHLHKSVFHDAVVLRCGWSPQRLPTSCACGSKLSIDHALLCPKGGFPLIRHNEICDLTANLMTEVRKEVCIEPVLLPLTGEVLEGRTAIHDDGARLDIAANGFWGRSYDGSFLDVHIFDPHAPSNSSQPIAACYRTHEKAKKRVYEQRVREVQKATFTPLVLSASGGMACEATHFYQHLASRLAEKWYEPYSTTMAWLRCRISFTLLRSAIQSLRGAWSCIGHAVRSHASLSVVNTEAKIDSTHLFK